MLARMDGAIATQEEESPTDVDRDSLNSTKGAPLVIFSMTFLNTLGMTIIIPVVPFLVQHYAHSVSSVAVWVGILVSAYALCSFLAAPALGALSDRIGRKPVLIASVLGSAVGFVVFGFGGALWVLLAGRIIDGLTGGNISAIFAYLADITPLEDRASRFGLMGAVSGIGFMIGPAVGGLLSKFGLSTPVFVAAGVAAITALLGLFVLPESLDSAHRSSGFSLADIHPLRNITDALGRPDLRPILLVVLTMTIPMAGLQSNLSVFSLDVLHWGPTTIGLFMLGVGVLDIIVQGGLVRFLAPRIGEARVVVIGMIGQAIGYATLAFVASHASVWLFIFGGLMFAASEGGTGPALSALASHSVSPGEQGWLMGSMQSMNSAARVVGPLLAGALYAGVGRSAPCWFGLIAIAAIMCAGQGLLFDRGVCVTAATTAAEDARR
jgi:DHA1 family tetracycline resistance protein-like MFS transporter